LVHPASLLAEPALSRASPAPTGEMCGSRDLCTPQDLWEPGLPAKAAVRLASWLGSFLIPLINHKTIF
ncbi:hypothetical protein, partial [Pseudomonas fluorescens]|uniref:hypothetical protein n=1 Tax=Pseudomonas fluorescens TaxID=294 RepID=UPI001C54730F